MTDEKFTFIEDLRSKKKTATGAHHKRTHCGKGGAVKFPSDFMTKKERDAMNGEVKSYRLNDPMRWAEFKAMPDDIKCIYIKALREKYNVSDKNIGEMLGVAQSTLSNEMVRLGLGKGYGVAAKKWNKDGWYAWVNGVPLEAEVEVETEAEEVAQEKSTVDPRFAFRFDEAGITVAKEVQPSVPVCGRMELEGTVAECAETLRLLLSGNRVKLSVAWTVT